MKDTKTMMNTKEMKKSQARGFSIRIFVPDGDPNGLRIVEKSNWTGRGVVFTRAIYQKWNDREEFEKTGVYVLVGNSQESQLPLIYVGEGDPVQPRFDEHYKKKDFWTWAVFFVSKDHSLNKAHVKYLESRLFGIAQESRQCKLTNKKASLPPSLSEMEIADVESFLEDMLDIFPLLNLNIFESSRSTQDPKDLTLLNIESKGVLAQGHEDAKGFVVCKGSQVVKETTGSIPDYLSSLRQDLLDLQVLKEEEKTYCFMEDHLFSSASTAAGVVLGSSSNGRTAWKDPSSGKTLKELQKKSLEEQEKQRSH